MSITSATTVKPLIEHLKKMNLVTPLTTQYIKCIILISQAFGLYTDVKDWRLIDNYPHSDTLIEVLQFINDNTIPPASINIPQELINLIKNSTPEEIHKKALIIYHFYYNPQHKHITNTKEKIKIIKTLLNVPEKDIQYLIDKYNQNNAQKKKPKN